MQFKVDTSSIRSYRRLDYQPWYAIAELVDNSTQSFFNNEEALREAYAKEGEKLTVSIVYDKEEGILRVVDNAMGMSQIELEHALEVARKPDNDKGRSTYGMGLKTASCWIGNVWTVRTKKLGEDREYSVTVEVERVANGDVDLMVTSAEKPADAHYTIVEIKDHNRVFKGRTIGKIRDFLRSMYRSDLRTGLLKLEWNGTPLEWVEPQMLMEVDGKEYKMPFSFDVDGHLVKGWIGVLARGRAHRGRAKAGFAILKSDRVIKGWPEAWRPEEVFGQLGGSNDLVNQRLVGEIHLDDFEVSHTKDNIVWLGDQEEKVGDKLAAIAHPYREIAKADRDDDDEENGPSDAETQIALEALKREIESPEFVDKVTIGPILPEQVVNEAVDELAERIVDAGPPPTYSAKIADMSVHLHLSHDMSNRDPYVLVKGTERESVIVIVNMRHPHLKQVRGVDGLLNYFRYCIYDAIAEHQARHKAGTLNPDTIRLIKSEYLCVWFEMREQEHVPFSPTSPETA